MIIGYLRRIVNKLKHRNKFRHSSWSLYKDYVKIDPTAVIAPTATIQILNPPSPPKICLEIGEGCHIFSRFAILRPDAYIKIGRDCQLGSSDLISAVRIEIESDVIMAWGVTVIDSDNHSVLWEDRKYDVTRSRKDYIQTRGQNIAKSHDWTKVKVGPVRIGAKSWIGFNSLILKDVEIGEGAVIGAGSVVRRDIKNWHIAMGNPCIEIRQHDNHN